MNKSQGVAAGSCRCCWLLGWALKGRWGGRGWKPGAHVRSRGRSPVSWAPPTRFTLSTCWHIHRRTFARSSRYTPVRAHTRLTAGPSQLTPCHCTNHFSEQWWKRGAAVESPTCKVDEQAASRNKPVCTRLRCKLHLPINWKNTVQDPYQTANLWINKCHLTVN